MSDMSSLVDKNHLRYFLQPGKLLDIVRRWVEKGNLVSRNQPILDIISLPAPGEGMIPMDESGYNSNPDNENIPWFTFFCRQPEPPQSH